MEDIGSEASFGGGPSAPARLTGGQETSKEDSEALTKEGKEGVQLRLDWLDLTFPGNLEQVKLRVSLALGCDVAEWEDMGHGARGYRYGATGPAKSLLWWGAPKREDCHVQLPGLACRQVGSEGLASLLWQSEKVGASASRIDLALDDFERRVSVEQVRLALAGPEAVTHAQEVQLIRGFGIRTDEIYGDTLYVGAPGSRQRLRVYDKNLESKGEIDAIRWELQDRDEAAESLRHYLAVSRGSWGKVARDRFVSFVDFRTAVKNRNYSRTERLAWYESLMEGAERVKVYPPLLARTLWDLEQWVDGTTAPSLAVIVDNAGGDIEALRPYVEAGRLRYRAKHKAILVAERKAQYVVHNKADGADATGYDDLPDGNG